MNIVILHGWGHSAKLWKGFSEKFSKDKVLVLDLPGFGDEKLVYQDWGVPEYAKWVEDKLKSKKLDGVVLIGHSFGGKIATQIAIDKPKLVKKMVLIAAPVLRRPSIYTKQKIAFYKLAKMLSPKDLGRLFSNSEYKEAQKNGLGEIFKKSVEYDRTNQIKKLKMPVLLIWGNNDKTAPVKIAKEMQSLFTNSSLEIVKDADHNLQIENPHILFGLINKFIHD